MSRDLNALWYDRLRALAVPSLVAATTGTGAVVDFGGMTSGLSIYVDWAAGVSAGVVVVETAPSPTYAGTWALLQTFTFSGGAVAFDRVAGALLSVRARVTTNVVGGTVSVTLVKEP